MKHLTFIFLLFLVGTLPAQNILEATTEELEVEIVSDADVKNFLSAKFNLLNRNIAIVQSYKVESLTGAHYTFSLYFDDYLLSNLYLKAHVSNEGILYFIQSNFGNSFSIQYDEKDFNQEIILRNLEEEIKVHDIQKVLLLNTENQFEKAIKMTLYHEATDFYVSRTYFSNTEFIDKSLKVHFAPRDTIIRGKVFMPDPLTSSENVYGGKYQDSFKKDTSVIIIKQIANTGQTTVDSDTNYFELHGVGFNVNALAQVNKFTGNIIYFVFESIYLNVEGDILGYNTKFIDDTAGYKSKIVIEDFDYLALTKERVEVEMLGDYSASRFRLQNDFFEIDDFSLPNVAPYVSTSNKFFFKRSHSAFEEVNAFFHLNNFHGYLKNLGFLNVDQEKIKVDVHGAYGGDNAFFTNVPTPRLIFGDGGVDDAEDADVVIHEYAHALSYFASPFTNDSMERRALDEAWGDYFSSSYSSQFSEFNIYNVFSWDGHNEFWDGRITNSTKTYEDFDIGKSIYANAEIWSSTLMDIFNVLGREKADKLVLESLYFSVSGSTFSDFADILLLIDGKLFKKKYKCDIYNVLVDRKFKTGFCMGKKIVTKEGLIIISTENFSDGTAPAEFYIADDNFLSFDYSITDALGRVMEEEKNITTPKLSVDPALYVPGSYYLRIQTNATIYKTKLQRK